MSVFTLSDESRKLIDESDNAVVKATRSALYEQLSLGAAAEANLSKVRDAKAEAEKAIDESDAPEAVEYRKVADKVKASDEKEAAELQRRIDAIKAEFAEEVGDRPAKRKAVLSEAKAKAIQALGANAVADIDTTTDAAIFTGFMATVAATLKLYKSSAGLEIPFSTTSAAKVVEGKKSSGKSGDGWKPRFSKIVVDGAELQGTVNDKGAVQGVNLTGVAKSLKMDPKTGPGFLQTRLLSATGTRDLTSGQEYEFSWTDNGVSHTVTVTAA